MAAAGNRNGIKEVRVWLIDLAGREERLLYGAAAAPIGWTEDGSAIYVALERQVPEAAGGVEARILRIPIATGEPELLVAFSQGKLERWSDADIRPDGSRIAVSLHQYSADLWRVDGLPL
jgi:hypothetical protein